MKLAPYTFPITYSYSRAIQDPVLEYFSKHLQDADYMEKARAILTDRLDMNTWALTGEYETGKETGVSAHVDAVTGSQDL